MRTRLFGPSLILALVLASAAEARPRRLLYVASPGIRNYVEYGGVGLLVYDIDAGHRWVKRIPTFPVLQEQAAENVKGIAAHAGTSRVYVSTPKRVLSLDLQTEQVVWNRTYEGGADRMSLSPDGKVMYLPSFEGPHWHVVDASSGEVIKRLEPRSGAHNTLFGASGRFVYLAGLKSPLLSVADSHTHEIVRTVGPFTRSIRPFTLNGKETLVYVNVNELLGFEIGDLRTGKMIQRVEVQGFEKGPVKRHGCPSHGLGLTPNERELWLADGHNSRVHVFDLRSTPPRQTHSLAVRDQPGWVTFSIDGRWAYPSTGEVFDARTKKIAARLTDEEGRMVQSEKMIEIQFEGPRPLRTGDQFGVGRRP